MMKKSGKKWLALIIATLMLAALFVGCRQTGKLGDTEYEDDFDETQTYTITFHGWGSAEEQANYQELVNQFMVENPNIVVAYTAEASSTYMTTLSGMANNLPDVFYMPDEDFLMWADSGRLLNIRSGIAQEELDKVWPEATDKYYYNRDTYELGYSEDAGLYGLPKDLGPFTLVYNKTLLQQQAQKYGVSESELSVISADEPMTWGEFRSLLTKLIKAEDVAKSIYGVSHYEIQAAVYSNNADFFTEDTTTSRITETAFTDAMQFIADLYLEDKVMPSPDDQSSNDGYTRFLSGSCIFSFMGPWDCTAFWEQVNFDYDIIPVPYGPGPDRQYDTADDGNSVAWVGSMAYSISAKTQAPGAALKLVEYLCMNEDAQRLAYSLGQQVPNLIDMANNEYVNNTQGVLTGAQLKPESRAVFVDTIDGYKDENDKVSGRARATYYTYDSIWYDDFMAALEPLWNGTKTAEVLMKDYNATYQASLDDMLAQYRG